MRAMDIESLLDRAAADEATEGALRALLDAVRARPADVAKALDDGTYERAFSVFARHAFPGPTPTGRALGIALAESGSARVTRMLLDPYFADAYFRREGGAAELFAVLARRNLLEQLMPALRSHIEGILSAVEDAPDSRGGVDLHYYAQELSDDLLQLPAAMHPRLAALVREVKAGFSPGYSQSAGLVAEEVLERLAMRA